jgi:hypothetical protein
VNDLEFNVAPPSSDRLSDIISNINPDVIIARSGSSLTRENLVDSIRSLSNTANGIEASLIGSIPVEMRFQGQARDGFVPIFPIADDPREIGGRGAKALVDAMLEQAGYQGEFQSSDRQPHPGKVIVQRSSLTNEPIEVTVIRHLPKGKVSNAVSGESWKLSTAEVVMGQNAGRKFLAYVREQATE